MYDDSDSLMADGEAETSGDSGDSSTRTFRVETEQRPSRRHSALSWAITVGIAVVLTMVLKAFILQVYYIPSESMEPTIFVGDRVVVSQLSKDPGRGDIIVFDRPPNDPKTKPSDPDVLIKRVIGLSGETVESRDGVIYVDGKKLAETYLPEGTTTDNFPTAITVPKGDLLVLGDNRSVSFDGRRFGPISKDLIVGRAVALIWPLSRISSL